MSERTEPQLLLEDWAERREAEQKHSLAAETQSVHARAIPLTKERILKRCKIDTITGCWIWQANKNRQGYGKIKVNGKYAYVHRVAYELWKGPLPKGVFALHDCPMGDNPSCCNPGHLWPGTKGDNNRDSVKKGRNVVVNRKLTPDQVVAIRSDSRSQQVIAKEFGVHQTSISQIKRRENYRT